MTVKVRRALVWSGLFVLAFLGGNLLGRFTVAGISIGGTAADYWASLEQEANDRESARQARLAQTRKPPPPIAISRNEQHVCEGCDAGLSRDRHMMDAYLEAYGLPPLPELDLSAPPLPPVPPRMLLNDEPTGN